MGSENFSLLPTNSGCPANASATGINAGSNQIDEFEFASAITSNFEGGKADSLQTQDSGIVSYGKHQATLASGTLEKIISSYLADSNTDTATSLEKYIPAIKSKDEKLRTDETFLSLLTSAAREQAMINAQEQVFSQSYWAPVKTLADKIGICSPLGKAILYDTKIQGGLATVLARTIDAVSQPNTPVPTEQGFLATFLKKRRDYLEGIAKQKRDAGDESSAKLLENSADSRISALETMLSKEKA